MSKLVYHLECVYVCIHTYVFVCASCTTLLANLSSQPSRASTLQTHKQLGWSSVFFCVIPEVQNVIFL